MKMEQELYRGLVQDIVEDEKKLKDLKEQLLAKKIAAKAMKKKAETSPLDLPSQFFSNLKLKMTASFARMHDDALKAVSHPEDVAADKLMQSADKLLTKARKIEDNTQKKAEKFAIRCAEMVMRLEEAAEFEGLSPSRVERLGSFSIQLDEQVQRLRPVKKEKEECSAQQSPSQPSPQSDVSSSTESSQEESASSLSAIPCSQTC